MRNYILVVLFGCLWSQEGVVLSIGKNDYSLHQFYTYYPRKQWDIADSIKRDEVFAEFIRREACVLEAKNLGLYSDPDMAIKIRNNTNQLLVNETYEQLVAVPLIDPEVINDARVGAKSRRLIHHILIGHNSSELRTRPDRTKDEALLLALKIKTQYSDSSARLAGGFGGLVEKYSDDPNAKKDGGLVGWVEWGETVHKFQSVAFMLDRGVLSNPVLTAFGYHLILVEKIQPSSAALLSDSQYESFIIDISKGSVRNRLRSAAVAYDSLQLQLFGVVFNDDGISHAVQLYNQKKKEASISSYGALTPVDILSLIDDRKIICVYGGRGFGIRWFANKLNKISHSRRPSLDTKKKMVSVFQTIILQDIALIKGREHGVDKTPSFVERKNGLVASMLYDRYISSLIDGTLTPDSVAVKQYYKINQDKYMGSDMLTIRDLRVGTRTMADSLLLLIRGGMDFVELTKKHSSINPGGGGVVGPFSRNTNRAYYDAAKILGVNGTSPVLSAGGGSFSIIMLIEEPTKKVSPLNRVYAQIEALLLKGAQEISKKNGVDALIKKYDIVAREDLLR